MVGTEMPLKEIASLVNEETTDWFDSHSADKDRIAVGPHFGCGGVFLSNLEASDLFQNFDAAAREFTHDFYREVF